MKPDLTVEIIKQEAADFGASESLHCEPSLFGITDGKAVGTYLEHKFITHLRNSFTFAESNSAKGIDFPALSVDLKVTSFRQPQSSCPFRSGKQKVFGLGYSLLVFVYEKTDDDTNRTGRLNILHSIFVDAHRTADYQTTAGIHRILENDGNADDLMAFLEERMLPIDSIEAREIVEEVMVNPPEIGYLTISNALQWRLQYGRVIEKAGDVDGIIRIH